MIWRVLSSLLLAAALLLASPRARAQEARRAGAVRVEVAPGLRGPLELKPSKDGFSGELSIVNDGKEPLVVSRIAVRGEATDPRAPPKLVARLSEGVLPATIPPGATRKATVVWTPDKGIRLRQLFGHVIVTTSDELRGEVAMGVRAQIPGPLGPLEGHLLSILIGIPLLGALVTFLARAAGRRDDRTPHVIACTALAVQAATALWIYRGFVPDVSRADGNDGIQFIEHVIWIRSMSAELFLGVDGTSVGPLLIVSVVALLGMLSERTVPRGVSGYHAAYLVLSASVAGAMSSMDALVFLVFTSGAVVSAALLVGGWGAHDGEIGSRTAGARLALVGTLAVVLLAVACIGSAQKADATFLVDGTKTTTIFSFPELSRVAFGAKGAKLFGVALPKAAFVLVLVASLAFLASFPFHGWLGPTFVEAGSAPGALVAAALPTIGIVALLRIGCAIHSEGARWASGVVVALGAVSAAYGALSTLGERDLRRVAAHATTSQVGFALLGIGSLTPQGIAGAMTLASTRALSCALFLLLAGAISDRVRTRDTDRLAGLASQMPGWATALAVAGLGHAAVLGFGGSWGPLLAVFGALPNYAPLAVVASLALVVLAAAHLFLLSKIAFGVLDPAWEKSPLLEPYGGRFPELTSLEWLAIAPLATLVVLLGLWPAPLLSTTTGTVRDLTNAVSPPGPDQIG